MVTRQRCVLLVIPPGPTAAQWHDIGGALDCEIAKCFAAKTVSGRNATTYVVALAGWIACALVVIVDEILSLHSIG